MARCWRRAASSRWRCPRSAWWCYARLNWRMAARASHPRPEDLQHHTLIHSEVNLFNWRDFARLHDGLPLDFERGPRLIVRSWRSAPRSTAWASASKASPGAARARKRPPRHSLRKRRAAHVGPQSLHPQVEAEGAQDQGVPGMAARRVEPAPFRLTRTAMKSAHGTGSGFQLRPSGRTASGSA